MMNKRLKFVFGYHLYYLFGEVTVLFGCFWQMFSSSICFNLAHDCFSLLNVFVVVQICFSSFMASGWKRPYFTPKANIHTLKLCFNNLIDYFEANVK